MNEDRCRPAEAADIYGALAELVRAGEPGVLATVISAKGSTPREAGAKMVVRGDGTTVGTVGGGAAEAAVLAAAGEVLVDGTCRRLDLGLNGELGVCGGTLEVFLEPVLTGWPFLVVGAGHVGRALVEVGRTLPFRFTVFDDREEFIEGFGAPWVRGIVAGPDAIGAHLPEKGDVAVLVASRDHDLDFSYIGALLAAENAQRRFAYCGVLGSRAKAGRLRQRLLDAGFEAGRIEGLATPAGLELGGETPAEIAVSVFAEALAVMRGSAFTAGEDGRPAGLRLRRRRD